MGQDWLGRSCKRHCKADSDGGRAADREEGGEGVTWGWGFRAGGWQKGVEGLFGGVGGGDFGREGGESGRARFPARAPRAADNKLG